MLHRRQPRHAPSKLDTRHVRLGVSTSITAVLLSVFALTRTERGARVLGQAVGFLEFYLGVFALVTLTATVALGLITTERVFLSPANRVRAQFAHRGAALLGMAFLVSHISFMVTLGHAPVGAVVVPVAGIYVGFGTIAFDLMLVVLLTGVLRGRFAERGAPWLWRLLHSLVYVAWPASIAHGMTAGRPPADWVLWSYLACLAAVASALLVRVVATYLRSTAVPEAVGAPVLSEAPVERPVEVSAPVSLAAARRKFREAG
ncbi:hypothetical protein ABT294_04365 [Nonomuraea sp. NPDC000554]|uniref:hypothetical protein n=1 Tax=Nonomuraea sp. NPDC000554 TaxID=3154259 RepID=UPI0033341940